MDQFVGIRYKLKSSENFEEYLKFINVGLINRKAILALNMVCLLTHNDDDSYTLSMLSAIKDVKLTFRLGEEFIEERVDGAKIKSIVHMEGDKVIQTQTEESGRKSLHVRHFTSDLLTVTSTVDGWNNKCIRIFEAVK